MDYSFYYNRKQSKNIYITNTYISFTWKLKLIKEKDRPFLINLIFVFKKLQNF